MKFQVPTIKDREWAAPLLEVNNYMASDFAFSNIFMWQDVVNTEIARYKDFILARVDYKDEFIYYQYPAGTGDIRDAIDHIIGIALSENRCPMLTSIPDEGVQLLKKLYPDIFNYIDSRDISDYVYSADDLANLPGSKYKKKRNHCSHFERSYDNWSFEKISEDVLDKIADFNDRWLMQGSNMNSKGMREEAWMIKRGLDNFSALGLEGGYLTIDDEIVAYSYGSPMGNQFVTHVEKALYHIHGGYAYINREMARNMAGRFEYINREDDLGEAGLRKAKLSYRPKFLVNKWRAEFKTWPPQK